MVWILMLGAAPKPAAVFVDKAECAHWVDINRDRGLRATCTAAPFLKVTHDGR